MLKITKFTLLISFLALINTCNTVKIKPAQAGQNVIKFRNINLHMEEMAHDGNFPLYPDHPFQKVDVNSVLRLKFDTPQAPDELEKSKEWRLIHEVYSLIIDLMEKFSELSQIEATLPEVEADVTESWRKKVRLFDQEFERLSNLLKQPDMEILISPREINDYAIQSGGPSAKSFYELLIEHFECKKRVMYSRARQYAEDIPQYEVIVHAYALPVGDDIQRLPVKGYDNLPSRPFRPIQRLSLIPNQAEAKRLKAEYEGAQLVKAAIVEIKANESLIKENFSELQHDIRNKLIALLEHIQAVANNWENIFDEAILNELYASDAKKVEQIKNELQEINNDIAALKKLRSDVDTQLERLRTKNLFVLLVELESKTINLQPIMNDLRNLRDERLKLWPGRIRNIRENVAAVAKQLVAAQKQVLAEKIRTMAENIEQEFADIGQKLRDSLPDTVAALDYISNEFFTKYSKELLNWAQIIKPEDTLDIPRPIDELEPAKVELARSGLLPGDMFEVDIGFFRKPDTNQPEKRINYSGQIVLTNWHRRFSGDMIFARSVDDSGSNGFRPNIGVSMEWHYFSRKKPNGYWNGLDMGFGMHAASLDQDADENVELGLGFNVSFFRGVLRLGYGWNLNAEKDREYYWIGFGLFGLLNQLNTIKDSAFSG